jgi:hypothetical protein
MLWLLLHKNDAAPALTLKRRRRRRRRRRKALTISAFRK